MFDETMKFSVDAKGKMNPQQTEIPVPIYDEKEDAKFKDTLAIIYDALLQKGYNPVNQIVGYILSEDPTYITTHNNARNLIRHIDRDELLQALVKEYLRK